MTEKQKELEGWVSIHRSSTDYESDMVRDRLDSAGIPAAVYTQRDHVLNLNVGALARVYVMVPAHFADEARSVLADNVTSEELEQAASGSVEVELPDSNETEQLLDSGIETIRFDASADPPDEERA